MKTGQPAARTVLLAAAALLPFALATGCAGDPHGANGANQFIRQDPGPVELIRPSAALTVPAAGSGESRLGAPLPLFTAENFIGSGRCALCHSRLVDRAGSDMSISNHWRSTMMANASRDPFWQAKVVSETERNPAVRRVIEEKCVTCHMPMAWTQLNAGGKEDYGGAPSKDTPFAAFLEPANPLHEAALDGVSCSLCHQIRDQGLGTTKSFSGKFSIDTGAKAPDRPIFGPYDDMIPGPMQISVGFTPMFGAHTNDSAFCAVCHTLYTPYLDAAGNIAGEFPEQTPYLEWLHSDYAEPAGTRHPISETMAGVRLCQDCHMPHSAGGGVMIDRPAPPQALPRDHFSQHHFVGGNILLLNILQDNLRELDVAASTAKIADTRARAVDLLQQQSAHVTFIGGAVRDKTLSVTIGVQSLAGHKFPTGFPSRRAWLHVLVRDDAGAVVFESGGWQTNGKVVGDDGDDKLLHEPHYDLITRPDQVQIYESIMQDSEGRVTHTLLRAAGYIKDNRLLPAGFDKRTAAPDIAVRGEAAADPNFIGGSDQVTYEIPLGGYNGPFTITAELLYATISHSFMQDLGRDAALPLVDRFVRYYDEADKTPVTVAAATGRLR
jgi:hypothetical protein